MFDDADPCLARVREIALAYPGAAEKVSHGRPNFFTRVSFCLYGGTSYESGERMPHDAAVLVKPDPADELALRQDPRFWVPLYLGPAGWLGFDVDGADVDWNEVSELIDASYRVTAPPTLLRQLEGRSSARPESAE